MFYMNLLKYGGIYHPANIKFSKIQLCKMKHSGGILDKFFVALLYAVIKAETQQLTKIAPELTRNGTRLFANKGINDFNKKITSSSGSE